MIAAMVTIYNATNGHIDGAPDGEYCSWSSYCDCDDARIDALDALQEMCRRDCDFRRGLYDPMGSGTCHWALEVLVKAGRLEWVGDESSGRRRLARDKEA